MAAAAVVGRRAIAPPDIARDPASKVHPMQFATKPMLGCVGVAAPGVFGPNSGISGNYGGNMQHVREIIGDAFTSSGVADMHDKANKRRPRWHRLPYGVPLCIGFVGYLIYLYASL